MNEPIAFRTLESEPANNVVEMLERFAKEAKEGKIRGAIVILAYTGGDTSDNWAVNPGIGKASLIGALHICAVRMMKRYLEGV
jgi:hypothetical protein